MLLVTFYIFIHSPHNSKHFLLLLFSNRFIFLFWIFFKNYFFAENSFSKFNNFISFRFKSRSRNKLLFRLKLKNYIFTTRFVNKTKNFLLELNFQISLRIFFGRKCVFLLHTLTFFLLKLLKFQLLVVVCPTEFCDKYQVRLESRKFGCFWFRSHLLTEAAQTFSLR